MFPETSNRGFVVAAAADRISRLPDSVLLVILSFLVTKEAVATSLLSRRWKSVWIYVPYLDFHFHYHKHGNRCTDFIDFVHHVLDLNTCSLLNKFNLVWYPKSISSSVTDTWINRAIATKNVRHLCLRCVGDTTLRLIRDPDPSLRRHFSLCFDCEYDYNFICLNRYVIPSNVFCSESLHSLELIACTISIDHETLISLPNLETLIMSPVTFNSNQACNMILSGCPLLKFLHLSISKADAFDVTISSDTLIHLELRFERPKCSFILRKAPALEYLMLKGGFITEISIEDTSLVSLVEAHLDVRLYYCSIQFNNTIVEAVGAFRSVKALTLSFDVLQALAKARIFLSTEFKRLLKLVAGTCSSIKDFIYRSENLQVLIIQKHEDDAQYGSDFYYYQSRRNNLEEVPRCLSNSLKEVRIFKYDGLEDEDEMIRFILQHGSVLEIMEISFNEAEGDSDNSDDSETHEEKIKRMEKKIRRFPRKCPVRFSFI